MQRSRLQKSGLEKVPHDCNSTEKLVYSEYMKQNVLEYTAVFEEERSGGYSVWVPSLPGCASQGETFEEALAHIKEAIELYLEDSKQDKDMDDYKRQFIIPVQIYA